MRPYTVVAWHSPAIYDKHSVPYPSYLDFQRLFRYISGANADSKKIDMTAPVRTLLIPGWLPAMYAWRVCACVRVFLRPSFLLCRIEAGVEGCGMYVFPPLFLSRFLGQHNLCVYPNTCVCVPMASSVECL